MDGSAQNAPTRQRKPKSTGNGRGSVFKRASTNKWIAQFSWVTDDGKVHRVTRVRDSQREAQGALRTLMQEHEDAVPKSSMKLKDWLPIWLADLRPHARPNTWARYTTMSRRQMGSLGERSLSSITTKDIEHHLNSLALTYSTSTVSGARNVLSGAFRQARRDGLITNDPVTDARTIARVRPEVPILDADQTERLRIAAIADHDDVGPVVVMLLASGARIGEVLALQVRDLDVVRGRIRIEKTLTPHGVGPTKSERGKRTVALPKWAVDSLADHIACLGASTAGSGPSSWMFPDPATGVPWLQPTFRDHYRRLLKRTGVPVVRVHALRHGHISHLIASGANLLAVSRRAGHASLAITTSTYGHVLGDADEDLAALL